MRGRRNTRFVCVFNRKRDGYQVPLALHEAGLLEALVTDFYAPAGLPAWIPRFIASRRVAGLPRRRTRSVWRAFVSQYAAELLRLPMAWVFDRIDPLLGRMAGRAAARRGQALYCYHSYLPRQVPDGARLIIFVFHPLPASERAVLLADAERFPEVRASAEHEAAILARRRMAIAWARADAVVCASSFTAASVIADGCPAARIAVIPYGLPERTDCPSKLPRAEPAHRGGRPVNFLFVGQGVQRKGLHHLIKAWQQWRLTAATPACLTLVCYRIDPAIAALIDHPSIELLGYQSREELDARFAAADVFVLPSLFEGFGLVYLEALAHGCHVIGTANTGLPDLDLPASAVTLVRPGDVDDLAAALQARAERKPPDRATIRAAAARWTQPEFRRAIAEHARGVLA